MAVVNSEDVRGYWVEQDLVCVECHEGDEPDDIESVLLENEMDDEKLYFCDRCKERIAK